MAELKRFPVKFIRDYIKKHYEKSSECYICGTSENLELHHLYSVSELFNTWCKTNSINIETITELDMLNYRVVFYDDYIDYLNSQNWYTLCKKHHGRLHSIYGQRYPNAYAKKVKKWIELQRGRHNGMV